MRILRTLAIAGLAAMILLALGLGPSESEPKPQPKDTDRPFGIAKRTPWTTSRISGSPEPPLPYRVQRAFPKLMFNNPLLLVRAPVLKRFFVGEQAGKLYSFPMDPDVAKADLFLDLTKEIQSWDKASNVKGVSAVYALAFHPKFEQNRYCYICYILDSTKQGEQLAAGTRVSRFVVRDTDPPCVDPASEKIVITWLAGGHNGCDLHFGPDGFLYISTGDATDPNPPDRLDTGQDLSDLLSSILRIDVDREENGKPYAIPADNPFVNTPNVRPENWAYGFRNPWRMSFDRVTGDLWVGDVGWELWEMIYRVKRGGNYGWSVMEGRQSVRPESRRGPTPILPPALDFPHSQAASITGGYVYRGKKLKDLVGCYVCGDWQTGKLWGTRFDGDKIVHHREIAQCGQRIVSFGEAHDGELYFLHHHEQGTIHQLLPTEATADQSARFPRNLSETGLFAAVEKHELAPGVVPFYINAEQWADHALAERFVALPGESSARVFDRPTRVPGTAWLNAQVFFPKDGVLAKTYALDLEPGNPSSRRRIETQILHFDGTDWRGYSYRWNDAQTDAELVPPGGADRTFLVKDAAVPGGQRRHTWHFPGRAECLQCHNPWAGQTLAFNPLQLNRSHRYGEVVDHQFRTLRHIGVVSPASEDGVKPDHPLLKPAAPLANPADAKSGLDQRARAYLHVNCSHCHQMGAGGTADIDFRHDLPLEQTKALEVRPVQGTFDIPNAQLIAPGDPYRSVLFYRMAKTGRGRMPHIGSEIVDEPGLRLIHDWIRQLPIRKDDRLLVKRLGELKDGNAPERAEVIKRLLSSTSSALLLLGELDAGRVPAAIRPQIIAAAAAHTDSQVRELFERFVPDEQRVKRLGSVIKPEQILSLKGDVVRGQELFFKSGGLQCANCHKVGGKGTELGPDLTDAGKRLSREEILENILEPSKKVDPKYVAYVLETTAGQFHQGLLVEKNEREVVLKCADGKEVRVPAGRVERLAPQSKSLMPELLLRDLSADQAADLLAYLAGLK